MSEDGKELRFYCHPLSDVAVIVKRWQKGSVYQYTLSSQYCIDWEIGSSRYFKDL